MQITLLKAKLHRVRVTGVERDYEGSCAIDAELLKAAGILEYEQIQVYNVDNGERFTTYAISAEAHSGTVCVNGAAAHKAKLGHRLIVCAYCRLDREQARRHRPVLVYPDRHNRPERIRNAIQAA